MQKMTEIRNIKQLDAQRAILQKRVNKQERRVMRDLQGVRNDLRSVSNRISRVRRFFGVLFPKMEYTTLFFPLLKRFFGKK